MEQELGHPDLLGACGKPRSIESAMWVTLILAGRGNDPPCATLHPRTVKQRPNRLLRALEVAGLEKQLVGRGQPGPIREPTPQCWAAASGNAEHDTEDDTAA
jgi:hypothetical protein